MGIEVPVWRARSFTAFRSLTILSIRPVGVLSRLAIRGMYSCKRALSARPPRSASGIFLASTPASSASPAWRRSRLSSSHLQASGARDRRGCALLPAQAPRARAAAHLPPTRQSPLAKSAAFQASVSRGQTALSVPAQRHRRAPGHRRGRRIRGGPASRGGAGHERRQVHSRGVSLHGVTIVHYKNIGEAEQFGPTRGATASALESKRRHILCTRRCCATP